MIPLKRQIGWSLLETVITMAIVLIVGAITLPSYRHFIQESERQHAENYLMALSIKIENYRLQKGHYPTNLKSLMPNNPISSYDFRFSQNENAYQISAIPVGGQQNDPCGRLSLDSNETKQAAKGDCWPN